MGYKKKHGSGIVHFAPRMRTKIVRGWLLLYTSLPHSLSLILMDRSISYSNADWSRWKPLWSVINLWMPWISNDTLNSSKTVVSNLVQLFLVSSIAWRKPVLSQLLFYVIIASGLVFIIFMWWKLYFWQLIFDCNLSTVEWPHNFLKWSCNFDLPKKKKEAK